jgi:L-threonine kinase
LLQGALPDDGAEFLVTLPIALSSKAKFVPAAIGTSVHVHPGYKAKSQQAADRALRALGAPSGGTLSIRTEIPEGKGLASSSADLVASVRAVGDAYGVALNESNIEDLLRGIEPSDGVMYSDIVSFDHLRVRLRQRLGTLPPLVVVGHDVGGVVDTVTFNQESATYSAAQLSEYRRLHADLTLAIEQQDVRTVGRISTRSAELSSERTPRRDFARVRDVCEEVDGLGLVIAHSGTYLGVLLDPAEANYPEQLTQACESCAELQGSVSVFSSLGRKIDPQSGDNK